MKITKRQTKIELNDVEKKIIEEATNILKEVINEMNEDEKLFGYYDTDWQRITSELKEASVKGILKIE
ncbi:MAG: hypothetical protein LIR46_07815 [Bacteroidota bacterium]|nr:hypothetical protein [Bacteroidota bacterium]